MGLRQVLGSSSCLLDGFSGFSLWSSHLGVLLVSEAEGSWPGSAFLGSCPWLSLLGC